MLEDILLGEFIDIGPALWVFLGVLGAFVVTRGITRFIRHRSATGVAASGPIKDITIGGVHIHHQVFGISLMFLSGLLLVTTTPQDALLDVLALLLRHRYRSRLRRVRAVAASGRRLLGTAGPQVDRCRRLGAGHLGVGPVLRRSAAGVRDQ